VAVTPTKWQLLCAAFPREEELLAQVLVVLPPQQPAHTYRTRLHQVKCHRCPPRLTAGQVLLDIFRWDRTPQGHTYWAGLYARPAARTTAQQALCLLAATQEDCTSRPPRAMLAGHG
jgi:hypothetical protein